MSETAVAENRKYPRCQLEKGISVAWVTGSIREVSRVTTVGLGGVFIHTPNPPREGTLLRLLFDLPSGEVRARAVVRNRKAGEGMGIQFLELRPEARGRLAEMMRRLLA
ncbi:MAG: PilZ domain-containing protein [Candidatus Acidiferrales bacterium]